MAVVFLQQETLPQFLGRLNSLTERSRRLWGKMQPVEMLAHLTRSVELSLGEHPIKDQSNIFTRTVVRWMLFHVITTWPRGKIKSPDYFRPKQHGDFDAEKQKLIQTMERFVQTAEREPERFVNSPAFGPMPLRYWRRVNGMHVDHHLRQFGA